MAVDAALRRLVRQRAGGRCEYCRLLQDDLPIVTFHVEHIISRQHAGTDDADFVLRGDRIEGLTPIGRGTVRLLDMNDEDRRQIRGASTHRPG